MKNNDRPTPPFALTPIALALAIVLDGSASSALAAPTPSTARTAKEPARNFAKKALIFEPNVGQADDEVQFVARALGFGIALGGNVLQFDIGKGSASVVHARFLGANVFSSTNGIDRLGSHTNYAFGADPAKWRNGVPNFSRVRIESLYPGIDAVFYGTAAGELEYDVILQPGAAPRNVRMQFQNAEWLELDDDGALKVHTEAGVMRIGAPRAYQTAGGRMTPVDSRFVLEGPDVVAFAADAIDPNAPLVIDPLLEYSSYMGGSGNDWIQAIAVDQGGSSYAVGSTYSSSFLGGSGTHTSADAFLSKFDAGGNLLYTSFFGGSSYDAASSVVLGSSGNVYVAGTTCSTNMPMLNAHQPALGGGCDAFLARFASTTGALQVSTYLGGSGDDGGALNGTWPDPLVARARPALTIGLNGEVVMAGVTNSANFPTAGRQLASSTGTDYDGFVARFSADGNLLMSTRLGGSGNDAANGVAVDAAGNIFIGGLTQTVQGFNGFVQRIGATGDDASITLGSAGRNEVVGVALGGSGGIWVGGNTDSSAFPAGDGPSLAGGVDMFVAMVKLDGVHAPTLSYPRLIGGTGTDVLYSIYANGADAVYGVGRTDSSNIPTAAALQARSGASDAYVFRFSAINGLTFATPLGGSNVDIGNSVVLGSNGLYVGGYTYSTDFPLKVPAQASLRGVNTSDGFISRIDLSKTVPAIPAGVSATAGNGQATVTFTAPSNGNSPITGYAVVSSPPGGIDSNLNSTSLTHVITGLTNGQSYTFTVTATNAVGSGGASNPSNAVTPAAKPGTLAAPQAIAGNGAATVTFVAPAANGSPITGYVVTSIPSGGIDSNLNSTDLSHVMTGLINGQSYTFTVTATNGVGTGSPSAQSNSVMPVGVPGAPASPHAAAGNGQATVSFNAPVSNGGSPITQYEVICATGCIGTIVSGPNSPIVVPNLTNGVPYTFFVIAHNQLGNSEGSGITNTVIPFAQSVPAIPVIVSALAGKRAAKVSFNLVPDNPTANGQDPTVYTVTCSATGQPTRSSTGSGSPIKVGGLKPDVVYSCTVTAGNSAGTSAPSAPRQVVPLPGVDFSSFLFMLLD